MLVGAAAGQVIGLPPAEGDAGCGARNRKSGQFYFGCNTASPASPFSFADLSRLIHKPSRRAVRAGGVGSADSAYATRPLV